MRIKNFLPLLLCLATVSGALAQVSLVLQVPPTGVLLKNQLWNMALINSGSTISSVTVQLTLLDAASGMPVMTATTHPIFLSRGSNPVTAKDVAPVQYDYLSPIFTDRDPNGFLPAGNFKACYTVLQTIHGDIPLTEDCIPLEVQPLSPPQLNTPADTSVVETAYPQFSWLPPTPVNLFGNLNYQLILVEVRPDQGAYQAIQQNIPVYNVSHLQDPVNLYPASGKPLDTGTLYAWRVLVLNDEQYIDQSDVWTFKLATPKTTVPMVPGGNFISLRSSKERSVAVQELKSDTIGVKYYSFDRDHTDTVTFSSADGKVVQRVVQPVAYGPNFFTYVLNDGFKKSTLYRVQVADIRKNLYSASFILK
jgi:hypothetical protein